MIKKIDDEEFRMMTGSIHRRLSPFPTTRRQLWNSDFKQGLMFFNWGEMSLLLLSRVFGEDISRGAYRGLGTQT